MDRRVKEVYRYILKRKYYPLQVPKKYILWGIW
jgi:hypothetical protein